jgi:hypothetical protein
VKSLKPKLKKALEAINKITTVQFDTATAGSQENEMFDADVDAAESSNILPEPTSDATSTSTQTATARLEQQTIDFFKIPPPPPQVNFKDATKTPANKSATFPTIVLYCPTFVGGMPTMPLTASTRNATSKHSNSRQDPKGKKAMHAIFLN